MMRLSWLAVAVFAYLLSPALSVGRAQAPGLTLVCDAPEDVIDSEALRAALQRELGVNVQRLRESRGPTLRVTARSLNAASVVYIPVDRPSVGRTVDLSGIETPVLETLGLLAANLLRDEASELLPPAQPSAAPPQPSAAPPQPSAAKPAPTGFSCRDTGLRRRTIGIDFVPMVGSSLGDRNQVERRVSLNVLGGFTGAVRGVEIAGVFNIDTRQLCGFQLSSSFNYVGGDVSGVQVSGANIALGSLTGVQLAQLNLATRSVHGAQIGLASLAFGELRGLQVGLLELAGGSVTGVQVGLLEIAGSGLHGAQLGMGNLSAGDTRGVQVGLGNVTTGEAHGAQVGLANVALGGNRGLMLGLVNVAQNADAAVGLLNVLWRGRIQLDAWATDAGLFMVGATHGGRVLHNVYGVGIKPMAGSPAFSFALGIGARVLASKRWTIDIDALSYSLLRHEDSNNKVYWGGIQQLRIPVSLTLVRGFALFVAPSLSVSVANADSQLTELSLYQSTRLTKRNSPETVVRIWPGVSLGARFF